MGGAWKVAYADFVTAMMAFFLLMWILNMTSQETKIQLAGIFQSNLEFNPNVVSPIGLSNNPLIQYTGEIKPADLKINESEKADIELVKEINQFLLKDALPTGSNGLTADGLGVLLHIAPAVLYAPGTVNLTPEGEKVLNQIAATLAKFKAYLVVRGHTDSSETGAPLFKTKWALSSARANTAVQYLISKGVDPKYVRSVSYADTRPAVPESDPDAVQKNGRVEFYFHRPEKVNTVIGY